ncbi:MAG: RNA methyltransferase substrate-binding domain-containing protein, partial [Nitriliruptoraceae bacterium]
MLTSTRNPRVRAARGLHRSRHRHATGRHLVEGPRAVVEALRAGLVEELYLDADDAEELVATWDLTPPADAPAVHVEHVTAAVLAALADATTPQGVVAVARTRTAELGQIPAGVVVVLDRVADPGNAGTVLRTADALLLAVPSPLGRNRQPDTSYIEAAAATVSRVARAGQVVSLESTTYPGTTEDHL